MIKKIKKILAIVFLWSAGWKIDSKFPAAKKQVFIVGPHTSNWDYIYLILASMYYGVKLRWVGKKELFELPWPISKIMYATGGIPVDRTKKNNIVKSLSDEINKSEEFYLCIPPEGSRSKQKGWRTGFYYIAVAAQVPISCGYLDYKLKRIGVKDSFMPSKDIAKDFLRFKEIYELITPKRISEKTPVVIASREDKS